MIFQEAKAAVDLAKDIASHLRKTANHDPELMEMFVSLRSAVLDLYEENTRLQSELIAARSLDDVMKSVVYDKEYYAYFDNADTERDEPFCQVCLDDRGKRIRMVERTYHWVCGVCEHVVYAKGGREREKAAKERQKREREAAWKSFPRRHL